MIRAEFEIRKGGRTETSVLLSAVTPAEYRKHVAAELKSHGASPESIEDGHEACHAPKRVFAFSSGDGRYSLRISSAYAPGLYMLLLGGGEHLHTPVEYGEGATVRLVSVDTRGVNPLHSLF